METTIATPKVKMETLENIKGFELTYRRQEDTLFFSPDKPRQAVSIDYGGEFWIRVSPDTGEVVGLEIENFETVFLKKHPELQKSWQDTKSLCRKKFPAKCADRDVWDTFLLIVWNFLLTYIEKNPRQGNFGLLAI